MATIKRLIFKDCRGNTMLEFAMIAVVLILIMFGIIQGGMIFSSWLVITSEAREAARYGVVAVGDPARQPTLVTDVRTHVSQRTTGILDQTQLTSIAILGPDPAYPQWLRVQINYNVRVMASPLLAWFPKLIPLSAVSTMRTEDGAVGGG